MEARKEDTTEGPTEGRREGREPGKGTDTHHFPTVCFLVSCTLRVLPRAHGARSAAAPRGVVRGRTCNGRKQTMEDVGK